MLSSFICGSFQNDDEETISRSPFSSPKRSWMKRRKGKKNPFSSLGLEKFQSLVADLEEKRKKVYSQMDSEVDQETTLVRFVYSSSENDAVPILIKQRDGDHESSSSGELSREKIKGHRCPIIKRKPAVNQTEEAKKAGSEAVEEKTERREMEADIKARNDGFSGKWLVKNLRRPAIYIPVVLIMILVLLVFFGRSMAIMCTSIGWYILPKLASRNEEQPKKKYVRAISDMRVLNTRSSPSSPSMEYCQRVSKSVNENQSLGGRESF